jgi:acetylornithine deacetylase/succinyl-diaminopimelate desuccinylase-like protein
MRISRAEKEVLEQLERGFPAYLEDVRAAIRQPSVSRTGEGVEEMAVWLVSYLKNLGAEARLVPGVRFPIVEGELLLAGSSRTLLFYELYDVQPAEETGWISPPFGAEIHPAQGGGSKIVGRGAFNSKGPLVGFLTVLRAFRDVGIPIPVNFRFLIEGEEEIGSPSLEPYIRRNLERLRQCDAAFIPYMATNSHGKTQIRLGFKGLLLLEFSVEGGAWGGPAEHDLHAMHTAWIHSPTWELLCALTSLQSREGCLRIDGLDPFISGPSAEDRELIQELALSFESESWLAELGAHRFKYPSDPVSLLTHLMFDPTLNIQSLWIGQSKPGEEPPTVMSRRALAHADLRLVPGMDVDTTVNCLRAHLDRRGFQHVKMRVKAAYPWSKTSTREPVVRSLIAACRRHAKEVEIFPLHAGAAPLYLFTDIVGIPFAFGGLGHGMLSHVANEHISVEGFRLFQRSMASFLFEFARRESRG